MWKDYNLDDIVLFIINNKLKSKYLILGYSFLFDYKKFPEIFDGLNGIAYKHRRLANMIVTDMTNAGYRCKRAPINNEFIKIQIFVINENN